MQTIIAQPTFLEHQFIGADELRRGLTTILQKIKSKRGDVVVTQHGRPRAVLVNLESYLELHETLQDLQKPGFIASIYQGANEIDKGEGLTLAQLKKRLRL